jgi:hypothetical protein
MEYKAGTKLSWSGGTAIILSNNKVLLGGGIGHGQIVSMEDFGYIVNDEMLHIVTSVKHDLVPFQLEAMRQSKQMEDDKRYRECMKQLITNLYTQAIQTAKSGVTSYKYSFKLEELPTFEGLTKEESLTQILNSLRTLFPGCRVSYSKMAMDKNRQMHDITNMDDITRKLIELKLIDITRTTDYIVIDWTKAEEQGHG